MFLVKEALFQSFNIYQVILSGLLNSILDVAEERITELEDRFLKITQSVAYTHKEMNNIKEQLRDIEAVYPE